MVTGEIVIGLAVEEIIRMLLMGFLFLIPVYLISVRYTSSTGQASVRNIVHSKWSPLFWMGVVVLGMVIPLAAIVISLTSGLEESPTAFLYAAILSGLLGDLAMRYLILRCGLYSPLIPSSSFA